MDQTDLPAGEPTDGFQDGSEFRTVAVIIPFYQKEPGILRRAMDSVMHQDLPKDIRVHVYIVDDSSPLSPDGDLSDLTAREDVTWSLHHQPNAGPGAARNTGLGLASTAGADFVAFLDSDDEWKPPHLADGIWALDQGYDFYFCDNVRDGEFESHAQTVPSLRNRGELLLPKAHMISSDGPVLGFEARSLINELVENYLCQTSTVLAKLSNLAHLEFKPILRKAGEDYFFWLEAFASGARVAASWRKNVRCGKGINIYFSAFSWDSAAAIDRLGNLVIMVEMMNNLLVAEKLTSTNIGHMRTNARKGYAFLLVRGLLKNIRPSAETFRNVQKLDRFILLRIPFLFLAAVVDNNKGRREW